MPRKKQTPDSQRIEWASLSSDSVMLALARYPGVYLVYRWLECQVGRPLHPLGLTNAAIGAQVKLGAKTVGRYLSLLEQLGLITVSTHGTEGLRTIAMDFRWPETTKGMLATVARGDLELDTTHGTVCCINTPSTVDSTSNPVDSTGGQALEKASKSQPTLWDTCTSKQPSGTVEPEEGAVLADNRMLPKRYIVLDSRVRALSSAFSKDLVTRAREGPPKNLVLVGLNARIVVVVGSESDSLLTKDLANDDTPTISRIFEHWKRVTGHKSHRLTPKVITAVRRRLKTFTEAELLEVCERIATSEWHMGRNPGNKDYSDIPRNFRSDDKVQEWLTKPKLSGRADTRHLGSGASDRPVEEEEF